MTATEYVVEVPGGASVFKGRTVPTSTEPRRYRGGYRDEHPNRNRRRCRLAPHWRTYPAPPALAMIGKRWFRESRTAVLSVPSVVIPHERNFVLNPL